MKLYTQKRDMIFAWLPPSVFYGSYTQLFQYKVNFFRKSLNDFSKRVNFLRNEIQRFQYKKLNFFRVVHDINLPNHSLEQPYQQSDSSTDWSYR